MRNGIDGWRRDGRTYSAAAPWATRDPSNAGVSSCAEATGNAAILTLNVSLRSSLMDPSLLFIHFFFFLILALILILVNPF